MKDFTNLEPMDYLALPWKRRWYFLGAFLAVLTGVSVYTWRLQDLYRSETTILVETNSLADEISGAPGARDRSTERVDAVRQLIESRSFLERLIQEYQLRQAQSEIPMEEVVADMRRLVAVSKKGSNAFALAYSATDPRLARDVVQRMAEVLIQTNQNAQRDRATGKDQFLEQELNNARNELNAIEQKIVEFKSRHLGELPEQNAANMNALNGLHTQLAGIENAVDRAHDQQKLLEFRLQEQQRMAALTQNLVPKGSPADAPPKPAPPPDPLKAQLAAKKAELAEMTAKYTERHPDVLRLSREVDDLEVEVKRREDAAAAAGDAAALTPLGRPESAAAAKPEGVSAEGAAAAAAEGQVDQIKYELSALAESITRREKERDEVLRQIDAYQKKLNQAPILEQEYQRLNRELAAKSELVNSLQSKKFNSEMMSSALRNENNESYRVIDPANLPQLPSYPNRLRLMLLGLTAALGAGMAAVFAREYFEPSLSSEDEAAAVLKLPVLACIPEIPAGGPLK